MLDITKFKGVIFDFNGTLFFDTPLHERAWREYAALLCGRIITDEEFRDSIHGRTNAEILKYFLGDGISAEDIAIRSEEKEAIYRKLCTQDGNIFRLAEGAEEFLDRLKAQNIPMAVATSSGRTNSEFYIEQFKMDRWFDSKRFIYNDGRFRSKPHPDIYLEAMRVLGISPEQCLVFEDMPLGIASANAAGVGGIIAVASALGKDYLLMQPGVLHAIDNYTELLDF